VELGTEGCLIRNEFPMAIDFTSVLNSYIELILIVNKDVTDVHLSDRELSLWTSSLTGHIEGKALF